MTRHSAAASLAAELGERLKQARLNQNVTQADVAERAGLSRALVINAEKGKAQLETFVAIMLALGLASQLDIFLPSQPISPMQLLKLQGKQRQRASSSETASKVAEDKLSW